MRIPHGLRAALASQGAAPSAYQIQRSLRFNSADSAYLNRTPASAGNRQTWTWSGWVKRSNLTGTTARQALFSGRTADSDSGYLEFGFNATTPAGTADTFYCSLWTVYSESTAVFRDVSAWYHIVVSYNGANIKAYVNNAEILSWARTGDLGINSAGTHTIGAIAFATPSRYFNGYLADIHFIDGQALTPTSFGEFDTNGVWQPKAYTGSYGTNGFKLDFADNSTAAALGTDTSGNSNTWTVSNISVAAGAGNDSLVDSPTNYGVDDGLGGSVRGNYCTLNPLKNQGFTLSNGNLDAVGTASGYRTHATMALPLSGKYYWEITSVTPASAGGFSFWSWHGIGYHTNDSFNPGAQIYATSSASPGVYLNGSLATSHTTWANGDIIGYAYDADASTLRVYRNGTQLGATLTLTAASISNQYILKIENNFTGLSHTVNFGQRPFAHPVSGFKALCTANLPTPAIAQPNTAMDVKLYTGNGSTQTISGLGFSPDLVWVKARSRNDVGAYLFDKVRGDDKYLSSGNTGAEGTTTQFDLMADGFIADSNLAWNGNNDTYVAWTWDAGSSTVTNNDGSITSQVRANPSAGFSIVTYTGTGVAGTIGHGLNVAPIVVLTKRRDSADNWYYFTTVIDGTYDYLFLNTTTTKADSVSAVPTFSVINVSTSTSLNANGGTYVSYCFAPVAGYSSFGRYTGNGSADGPFVYTGLSTAFVMIKRTDTASDWTVLDYKREGYNVDNDPLYPNLSNAEGTTDLLDINSNGFKLRSTNASVNASAGTYIFAAFAQHPFQYARAR